MKIKKFDVIELIDGNKATILDNNKSKYYAEIVDSKGNTIGYRNISEDEIRKVIFSKDKVR